MAAEKTPIEETNLSGIDKLQQTYEQNASAINIGLITVLVLVAGLLYYVKVLQPQKELKAQEAIFEAQYYFEQDSFQMALNNGLIDVASNYGGTKAGKLAHYYAGVSYFNLGDFNSAIFYLKKFKSNDELLNALAQGALADAQMESGDTENALANYKKSTSTTNNKTIAPILLYKAALAHEKNGKKQEAYNFFKEIKDTYPNSDQARDIEKYIGRVKASL